MAARPFSFCAQRRAREWSRGRNRVQKVQKGCKRDDAFIRKKGTDAFIRFHRLHRRIAYLVRPALRRPCAAAAGAHERTPAAAVALLAPVTPQSLSTPTVRRRR